MCRSNRSSMEPTMATIVLKGVPVELRKRLEERARANGWSVSREVLACLEGAMGPEPRSRTPEEEDLLLKRVRENRAAMAARGVCITDEEITAWKRQGRP